jgi:hypothetical protein
LGKHIHWHQPDVFNHLTQSWERQSDEAGYANMMIRCLREMIFAA